MTSADVQFFWRQARACCWKVVLVQTQVMSVLWVVGAGEGGGCCQCLVDR